MFQQYLEAKEKARDAAQSLIGSSISYMWSGHAVTGEVIRVHKFTDQLWVRSQTGKEYYIFWSYINEDQ